MQHIRRLGRRVGEQTQQVVGHGFMQHFLVLAREAVFQPHVEGRSFFSPHRPALPCHAVLHTSAKRGTAYGCMIKYPPR